MKEVVRFVEASGKLTFPILLKRITDMNMNMNTLGFSIAWSRSFQVSNCSSTGWILCRVQQQLPAMYYKLFKFLFEWEVLASAGTLARGVSTQGFDLQQPHQPCSLLRCKMGCLFYATRTMEKIRSSWSTLKENLEDNLIIC